CSQNLRSFCFRSFLSREVLSNEGMVPTLVDADGRGKENGTKVEPIGVESEDEGGGVTGVGDGEREKMFGMAEGEEGREKVNEGSDASAGRGAPVGSGRTLRSLCSSERGLIFLFCPSVEPF